MSTFDLVYVSKVCPELTRAECEVVRDEVLVDYAPNEVYADAVRAVAKRIFPYVLEYKNVVYLNGKRTVQSALDLLSAADTALAEMSPANKSDNLAQIHLELKSVIHYLADEIEQMDGKYVL